MNNRQLEYFAETVKLKSFTKAANKLFVTQSALSKAIQSLESELGTVLIDRELKTFSSQEMERQCLSMLQKYWIFLIKKQSSFSVNLKRIRMNSA
ncbi:MAG: LysR family transcriptional regulator [Lachnospiraceae bacterium]